MTDTPKIYSVPHKLKVRLADVAVTLTRNFGGNDVTVANAMAAVQTTEHLSAVYYSMHAAALFQQTVTFSNGQEVPCVQMNMRYAAKQGASELHEIQLVFIGIDPLIGQQKLVEMIVTEDSVRMILPGLQLDSSRDAACSYNPGMLEPAQTLNTAIQTLLYQSLMSFPAAKGSDAAVYVKKAVAELAYVDPKTLPLSGKVMDNLEQLLAVMDAGLETAPQYGMVSMLQSHLRTLRAGETLTGQAVQTLFAPLEKAGVSIVLAVSDDVVSGLGLQMRMSLADPKDVLMLGIGLGAEVSLLTKAFALNVGGESALDMAGMMALKASDKGAFVARLTKAFGTFTADHQDTEAVRRRVAQMLTMDIVVAD